MLTRLAAGRPARGPTSATGAASAQPPRAAPSTGIRNAAGLDFPTVQRMIRGVYWGYGYSPTRRQYDATCSMLRGRSA